MAILFDVNISKSANLRSGFALWRLKELLVSTGQWIVIGSGDGSTNYAYSGVTGPLSPGDQGSGGSFDALKTGSGLGTLVAGDWSTAGWCVLRDVVGREVLLVDSNGTPDGSWNSYGRMAYSRTSRFAGGSAGVATIPGAASDEQWVWGARAVPNGVEMFDYATAGYVHMFAHDATTDGVAGFGWVAASTVGAVSISLLFSATLGGDANTERLVLLKNGTNTQAWASPTTAFATWTSSGSITHVIGSTLPVEPQGGGKEVVQPFFAYAGVSPAAITSADCGYLIDGRALRFSGSARNHPDVLDCTSSVWLVIASNIAMPWPSTATVPLSGTSVIRSCVEYVPPSPQAGVVPVNQELTVTMYLQRVWDTVNARWCYYDKSVIDSTPSTSETSPVNSGTITAHSVLAERLL